MDETDEIDVPRRDHADRRAAGVGGLVPWLLVVALLFFSLGMMANPWFEREVRTRLPWVEQEADLGSVSARLNAQDSKIAQLDTRVASLEQRPAASPGNNSPSPAPSISSTQETMPALNDPVLPDLSANLNSDRIARVETRVEAIDRQQTALGGRVDNLSAEVAGLTVRVEDSRGEAAGRMAQAERLAGDARAVLLLARARTAFDNAEPLGALGPALRAALAPGAGDDVDRLAAGMRDLVGPDELRQRFRRLRPALAGAAEDMSNLSFWERTKASIADIFTIRRSGVEDEGNENERIVAQIATALERGDVDVAVSAFARLPESVRQQGARWWIDAANYARTEAVLDRLEARVVSPSAGQAPAPASSEAKQL